MIYLNLKNPRYFYFGLATFLKLEVTTHIYMIKKIDDYV